MTILFQAGPMSGRFATLNIEEGQVRVAYRDMGGKPRTAIYEITETAEASRIHKFAAASYRGSRDEMRPGLIDWDPDGLLGGVSDGRTGRYDP